MYGSCSCNNLILFVLLVVKCMIKKEKVTNKKKKVTNTVNLS